MWCWDLKPLTLQHNAVVCRLLLCCQPRGGQGQEHRRSTEGGGSVQGEFEVFFAGKTRVFYSTPSKLDSTSLTSEKRHRVIKRDVLSLFDLNISLVHLGCCLIGERGRQVSLPVEHYTLNTVLVNHTERWQREGDWVTSCAPTLS